MQMAKIVMTKMISESVLKKQKKSRKLKSISNIINLQQSHRINEAIDLG